jgi:diguanylate cyclase (GGDEF)-like protein
VRAIDERHERERELTQLAQFNQLTGEMNRAHLIDVLGSILDEAVRFRTSCGFLLIAIDHLGRLNETYGFDVTEQVIAQLAKRLRPKLRGDDRLGRFSGNKFGVILKTCTPEELSVAAERLLVAVREEPMETNAGPVALTVTIGGVTRRVMPVPLQRSSTVPRTRLTRLAPSTTVRLQPIGPTSSATRCARKGRARPTRSSPRSTSGALRSPSSRSPMSAAGKPAFTNA